MKTYIYIIQILLLSTIAIEAQSPFPKSKKEDKEKIMSEAYWNIWNPKVQEKIDADIEKYRKTDAVINLKEIPIGTEIQVEQISHQFIFAAHMFNFNQLGTPERNERYKNMFGELFNGGTIAFYWKTLETEPNRLRFKEEYHDTEEFWNNIENPEKQAHWRRPPTDPIIEFCEQKRLSMHGHTIIWGSGGAQLPEWIDKVCATSEDKKIIDSICTRTGTGTRYKIGYTEYGKNLSAKEIETLLPEYGKRLKLLFAKRIQDLYNRYGNRLDSWDVVNESAIDFSLNNMTPNSLLCKSVYGIMPGDYTFEAFQIAQKLFGEYVKLNINDYKCDSTYTAQVNDLVKRGCRINVMGSQMHLFNPKQCADIADGAEIETPELVYKKMKTISKPELPIHLSEITITAPDDDDRGRKIQAIITQNLYRLWFSIPAMQRITWWNTVDGCGYPGEPTTSGIMTRNMEKKPAYYALDYLINHEWRTNAKIKTDKNGILKFRGFRGNYRLTWKDADGNIVSKEFYIK